MKPPEINKLKLRLLVALLTDGAPDHAALIAEATGERPDSVSAVLNGLRPLDRTRKLVADFLAGKVYELLGVARGEGAAAAAGGRD